MSSWLCQSILPLPHKNHSPPVSYTFHPALCSRRLMCLEFINDLSSRIAHKIHDAFEFQINNKILVCPIKYLGYMKNSFVVNQKLESTYMSHTFNLLNWVTLLLSSLVLGWDPPLGNVNRGATDGRLGWESKIHTFLPSSVWVPSLKPTAPCKETFSMGLSFQAPGTSSSPWFWEMETAHWCSQFCVTVLSLWSHQISS